MSKKYVVKLTAEERSELASLVRKGKAAGGQARGAVPGQPARIDYEYVREGVCTVWMFVEMPRSPLPPRSPRKHQVP